ncbi:AAA family ATPase [Methanobrevibacter sp.]|uniref:AAA family ATPase n=1 Tax=Methanobrevibacter sp. TaxID=66852 RepID=UPI00388F8B5F
MIFSRLRLGNFKSHQNTLIKFNKGISVIVGENGAGKSTILDAISFALFNHAIVEIKDLIRNNANSLFVELQFTSNGKEYMVVREFQSDLKSVLYTKTSSQSGFVKLCDGNENVNEEIHQILNLDTDMFLNAIYVRQGEIANLVDKDPSEKKLLISKLLGIESLEKACKNLAPLISEYENKLSELKGKLYNSTELKDEYDRKKDELTALKDKGHELEEQIEDVTNSLQEISESKRDMEREKEIHEKQLHNLETEKANLADLEEKKRSIQENLDQISEAEEKISRLEKYVSKLDVYLEFEKAVINIQNLKAEENQISDKLLAISQQKTLLSNNKQGYNEFLKSDEKISRLDDRKIKYEKELATMAQLEQDKKDLLRSIENERNDIGSFFSSAKDQLATAGLSQEDLDKIDEFSNLENANNDLIDEISNRLEELSESIISKNEDIAIFNHNITSSKKSLEELDNVEDKCPVCQSEIDSKKKLQLAQQYETSILDNEKLISQNEEEVSSLTKEKENCEENLEKLNVLSKKIVEYQQKFKHLERELVKLNKLDEGLESKEFISNKLGELILEIAKIKTDRESHKSSHDEYIKAEGALEVLGDETEVQFKLNQVENEIDTHVKNIKLAIEQDSHLSGDISASELQNRIVDLKQKNDEYNQLKGFIKNKNSLKNQFDALKEEIGVSQNQIEITQNKIEASVYDKEKYEHVVYRFEMYERKHNSFNDELAEVKGRARESISNIKDLKDKIETVDRFQQEYNDVEEFIQLLTYIGKLYGKGGVQKELKSISKPLIQKYTKEFFNEFNFDYSDLTLDDDYEITVYGPEGESSMSMVSGGEKIAIALALRLGITRTIAKGELDTILLDEPTIHLDDFRKHDLINLLKDISSLPQMIIVTHESQLENAADNLIKVEKENGISKIIN